MSEKKKVIKHEFIYLDGDTFGCFCGKTDGSKHVLTFSDGSIREECSSCFLFDEDAKAAGLLDSPESFVPKKKSSPKPFGYVLEYDVF
jgi:hypothetical protein